LDQATGGGAEKSVMYGVVACDATDQRAFYAALGIGRCNAGGKCSTAKRMTFFIAIPPISTTARSIPDGFLSGQSGIQRRHAPVTAHRYTTAFAVVALAKSSDLDAQYELGRELHGRLAQIVAVFVRASSLIIPGVNNSVRTGPRSEVTTSSTRFALKMLLGQQPIGIDGARVARESNILADHSKTANESSLMFALNMIVVPPHLGRPERDGFFPHGEREMMSDDRMMLVTAVVVIAGVVLLLWLL
jgi:hypothetical protein